MAGSQFENISTRQRRFPRRSRTQPDRLGFRTQPDRSGYDANRELIAAVTEEISKDNKTEQLTVQQDISDSLKESNQNA